LYLYLIDHRSLHLKLFFFQTNVMTAKRPFVAVVVIFAAIFVELGIADPETVDGLLKKRSEPVIVPQQNARALHAPLPALPADNVRFANFYPPPQQQQQQQQQQQPIPRLHLGNTFRQDSLARNFHTAGHPSRNGKNF
jgi:hypothetical protein